MLVDNQLKQSDPVQAPNLNIVAPVVLAIACLPILGALVIAPSAPALMAHFSNVPNVSVIAPFVLTAPALTIAIFSPFVADFSRRFSQPRMLTVLIFLYCLAGSAPLLLDNLNLILYSRIFLGGVEAFLITISTAIIADCFDGAKRDKFASLQVLVMSISAILFLLIGGALGKNGWRTPFLIYLLPLIFAPLCWFYIPERSKTNETVSVQKAGGLAGLPWQSFTPLLLFGFFASCCFNLLSVVVSFALAERGVTSAMTMGLINALNSAGIAAGTIYCAKTLHTQRKLIFGFILAAIGLTIIHQTDSLRLMSLGVFMSGVGGGIYFAHLLAVNLRLLPEVVRVRGTGLFMSIVFLANVVGPTSAMAIAAKFGSVDGALIVASVLLLILAVLNTRNILPFERSA